MTITRIAFFLVVCLCWTTTLAAEVPKWTFTEEQLRLFNPPMDADAEAMLEWCRLLEMPIPKDLKPYGGFDKYREQVQLMRIMVSRAILATDPPLELEKRAWNNLWFPYYVLSKEHNQNEWLPKMKAVYDELTELSRKKGEVLDQQTVSYLSLRGVFFLYISGLEKEFFSRADELIGEIDNFMNKHRKFDNLMSGLYSAKSNVLQIMSDVDEKYRKVQVDFKAEMKELFLQNKNYTQSPKWFHLLYPEDPYNTPDKQAEAYRLIKMCQNLIDTNEETKQFDTDDVQELYCHQSILFSSLVAADLANIPKLQAYLTALEKKNDPQLNEILFCGYRDIWRYKLQDFSTNGGGDNDLMLMFDAMIKFLDTDWNYNIAGNWFYSLLFTSPIPFEKCTLEQQNIFVDRLEQMVVKAEAKEKAWKEAGNPMSDESHIEPIRDYLNFLQLPGTVVSLTGKTVDGKAFDIEQYRGKVVIFHSWATWCGPCIRRIPFMKELYAKYHDRGFEVLGISYDFEPEKVQPFIDKHELPYLSLFDKDRKILNCFSHGNSTIDLLIDREGKAVFYRTDEELKEKLKELFAE